MTLRFRVQKILLVLISILFCLIPVAWSTEVNANYYTVKTFLLFGVAGLCWLYIAFSPADTKWSRTTHFMGLFGLFFMGLQIAYSILFNYPYSVFYLTKFFSLVSIFIFLLIINFDLGIFLKKYDWIFANLFALMAILSLKNLIPLLFEEEIYFSSQFIVPFGNVNMLSEFYLFCIPVVHFWLTQKNKIPFIFKAIIFVLFNLILLFAKSRSAYMGLCVWWMMYFFEFGRGKIKYLYILLVPVFFTALLWFNAQSAANKVENKTESTAARSNFYYATWDLIQDHPAGIGLQFTNKIVPYRLNYPAGPTENEYPDQPHSEILKWGAQFGWLGGSLALICFFCVALIILRKGSVLHKGILIVTTPQIFFQFPFENPAGLLALSFFLYFFYRLLPAQEARFYPWVKGVCAILAGVLIWQASIFIVSIYKNSHYPTDLEETTKACEINPVYMPGCVMKNYSLLFAKKYDDLWQNLRQDMKTNYYAADYLKILSALIIESDKDKFKSASLSPAGFQKICELIQVYILIYKNQKQFSDQDIKSCQQAVKPAIGFYRVQQFDHDYKIWIEKMLQK